MVGGDPAEPVGGAAGAERHHDLHRPVRPVLCCVMRRAGALAIKQAAATSIAAAERLLNDPMSALPPAAHAAVC